MVLFSHEFLVGIVGQSIVTFQDFGVSSVEDVEDGAILENEILVIFSGLLADYFEDVQSVEKYLILFELGDIH